MSENDHDWRVLVATVRELVVWWIKDVDSLNFARRKYYIYHLVVSIQWYQGQSPYGQPYIYKICVSRFVPFFLGDTIKLLVSRSWRRVSKSVLFTELSKFIAIILGAVIRYRSIWYPIVGECNLSCFEFVEWLFPARVFRRGNASKYRL